MKICECGCGIEVKETQKFVHGHNNKGKTISEETKKKIGEKSKGRKFTKEVREYLSNKQKELWLDPNGPYSKDRNKKISNTMKERKINVGDKNIYWKGGKNNTIFKDYIPLHNKAKKLFKKDKCEKCGKSNKDHIKEHGFSLAIHCTSNPKNYYLMEESNWLTLCIICHNRIEYRGGGRGED